MTALVYDLAIIGGGINGAGIARDAAGRGLRVILIEQDDLAAHTSSASTKLIHGGLRYLEHFEFMLVRKALQEREVILKLAPHITWPLRFVMPHHAAMRPEWMLRTGLFLYDHLATREKLPDSETIRLSQHPSGAPLKHEFRTGFVYSDGWVDDARLVVLNAMSAHELGAEVRLHTRCIASERSADIWQLTLHNQLTQAQSHIHCRAVVNAAGPWVAQLLQTALNQNNQPAQHQLRLVKGSHIVVPRLFSHSFAYIFQNPDQRIIFAIPYEKKFTLIGTTDVDYEGEPSAVQISDAEISYLCEMANRYFQQQISAGDVVHTYAGVRPLLADEAGNAASVTRDYQLELNTKGAPLLSVFGGKITTYRKLAYQTLQMLAPQFAAREDDWTAQQPLPGGDMIGADFDIFLLNLTRQTPWLPDDLRTRLAHAYGTRVRHILRHAQTLAELGEEIAPGVYENELHYTHQHEFTHTGDDFLWRRSKLGLHLDQAAQARIKQWFVDHSDLKST